MMVRMRHFGDANEAILLQNSEQDAEHYRQENEDHPQTRDDPSSDVLGVGGNLCTRVEWVVL
jgi:hypothetical protein